MPGSSETPIRVVVADPKDPEYLAEQVRVALGGQAAIAQLIPVRGPTTPGHGDATVLIAPPDLAAALMPTLPALSWVQSTFAGVAPILEELARRPNPALTLTAAKGIFGQRMAEYVFGWLLTLERRCLDYDAQQRATTWQALPWRDLAGRTMLLLGTGSIGSHIASVAASFGLRVTGVSRRGNPVEGIAKVRSTDSLRVALAEADYVVASLPDTAQTRGLLDAATLDHLRSDAILINVGRGTLLDEAALVNALRSKRLRAAVLDVFHHEPLPPSHPFWDTPGLHLTPHVAAATAPNAIAELFATNLLRRHRQEPMLGRVDLQLGY